MEESFFSRSPKEDDLPETADLQIKLIDAIGYYEQVNIEIVGIKIILNDSIIDLPVDTGIYNILEFVNGIDTVLTSDTVPVGTLSQIRLILGDNNSFITEGVKYDLKTPSAQKSGLKLNIHQELMPNTAYSYVIDFDVKHSIVKTGNDKYILKPVIRVFSEALTGIIKGIIRPVEAEPLIYSVSNSDTISTYSDTLTGAFMLRGLRSGYYNVMFEPEDPYKDTTLTDVKVVSGEITVLDTLIFN
ncbi:MAG: hypothetical protein AMS27_17040 [Bacteroides sp. SM23_62_1]|nr:MAG: hypothetical protein AMS27_17040 [Bacteroides sp. SM23_62_1]